MSLLYSYSMYATDELVAVVPLIEACKWQSSKAFIIKATGRDGEQQ